jgi:hypothetical protein
LISLSGIVTDQYFVSLLRLDPLLRVTPCGQSGPPDEGGREATEDAAS